MVLDKMKNFIFPMGLISSVVFFSGAALAAEPTTAQDVLAQMELARKAIRTASYEVRVQHQYVKPVVLDVNMAEDWADVDKTIVPAGTMAVRKQRFVFDGPKYRCEDEGPIPYLMRGIESGLGPYKDIVVFDGEKRIRFNPDNPSVSFDKGAHLGQFPCQPMLAFHFGLVTGDFSSLGELQLVGKSDWQGRSCYCLERTFGPARTSYWVDPSRDWSLVRETNTVVAPEKSLAWSDKAMAWVGTGLVEWEFEIQYEQDATGLWRPSAWTRRHFADYGPDRKLEFVENVRVKAASLNQEIAPATFVLDIPDGTHAYDMDRKVDYIWDNVMGAAEREAMVEAKVSEQADRKEARLKELEGKFNVGDSVPDSQIATADGKTIRFADYRGRVLLLDFWDQNDGRRATAALDAAFTKFAPNAKFSMICLHSADDKQRALAADWIAQKKLTWPVYWVDNERLNELEKDFGVSARGTVFVIGPDGKLLARNLSGEEIQKSVQAALNPK